VNGSADFSMSAMFAALDDRRGELGLTWKQVAHEINALSALTPRRPVSVATITNLRHARVTEADGVLQMLLWLRLAPENFVQPVAPGQFSAEFPIVPSDRILRFDTKKLYSALDAQRNQRGMTWTQVAEEIGGLTASSLTRLSKGGRTSFPQLLRITGWLQQPAVFFVHACHH
jgi:hypothetical protein